jgi:hypothetical protein
MTYKENEIMENKFRNFIFELSRRLADESDYEDELLPKLSELLNMCSWIIPEAWENGLGKTFKEVKNG